MMLFTRVFLSARVAGCLRPSAALLATGVCKHWDVARGFGFVVDDGTGEAHTVHWRDLVFARDPEPNATLDPLQRVQFDVEPRSEASRSGGYLEGGKCVRVTAVGGAGLPPGSRPSRVVRTSVVPDERKAPQPESVRNVPPSTLAGRCGVRGFVRFVGQSDAENGRLRFASPELRAVADIEVASADVRALERDTIGEPSLDTAAAAAAVAGDADGAVAASSKRRRRFPLLRVAVTFDVVDAPELPGGARAVNVRRASAPRT
jgi:cold shock CspA family protein